MTAAPPTGDDLVETLAALANPIRLRIVAKLAGGRDYVSHLAREIGVSRPLLHMHLQRLEAVGLLVGNLELSEDGKAMKFYQVADFDLHLTADAGRGGPDPDQSGPREGSRTQGGLDDLHRLDAAAFLGILLAVTVLIGGAIAAFVELRKTKIVAGHEDDLRQLVRRYEHFAENALDAQQRVAADVSELRSRTASIEQILRTVE